MNTMTMSQDLKFKPVRNSSDNRIARYESVGGRFFIEKRQAVLPRTCVYYLLHDTQGRSKPYDCDTLAEAKDLAAALAEEVA